MEATGQDELPGLERLLLQASPEGVQAEQMCSLPRNAALSSWELSLMLHGHGPKTNVSQEFIIGNVEWGWPWGKTWEGVWSSLPGDHRGALADSPQAMCVPRRDIPES